MEKGQGTLAQRRTNEDQSLESVLVSFPIAETQDPTPTCKGDLVCLTAVGFSPWLTGYQAETLKGMAVESCSPDVSQQTEKGGAMQGDTSSKGMRPVTHLSPPGPASNSTFSYKLTNGSVH